MGSTVGHPQQTAGPLVWLLSHVSCIDAFYLYHALGCGVIVSFFIDFILNYC